MEKKRIFVIAGLLLAALAVAYLAYTFWPALAGGRPTLMYFRADLWAYCKKMTPSVNGIKRERGRQIKVVFVSMDQAKGKALAKQHGVVGTPTILLLDSVGEQVNVLRGLYPPSLVEQAVEELLAQ